jgi:hypothetical protein
VPRKQRSPVSEAFSAAQAMNLEELKRFPLPVLRRALGLAKGHEKRSVNGGYDQVRWVIETAIAALNQ